MPELMRFDLCERASCRLFRLEDWLHCISVSGWWGVELYSVLFIVRL